MAWRCLLHAQRCVRSFGQFRMRVKRRDTDNIVLYSMLSVACDLAVDFEVYTLTNSDSVCDECCVLHVPRTRISNDESS